VSENLGEIAVEWVDQYRTRFDLESQPEAISQLSKTGFMYGIGELCVNVFCIEAKKFWTLVKWLLGVFKHI